MPLRGRRVHRAHPQPPTREVRSGSGDIEVHAETTLKVHNASQPTLNPDGTWEVMIDGKKYTRDTK